MPGPSFPVLWFATQYGFTNGAGAITNVVDGNLSTFYQPLATDFSAYTDQFFLSDGTLNYGKSFAAIELWGRSTDHDPVLNQHITGMRFVLDSNLTLSDCIIIGSQNQASSVSNVLQTGDVLLGQFTSTQLFSGKHLPFPSQQVGTDTFKYFRILQRSTLSANAPPDPRVGSNFHIFDTPGAQSFVVPTYSGTFTVELWGGAATGGDNTNGVDGNDTTCSTYSLTAGKGHHATVSGPNGAATGATGGTATGGNTTNTPGNPGQSPSPLTTGVGTSGAGGSAPNGGAGGDAVANGAFGGLVIGKDGQVPGGGGSGANAWSNTSGGVAFKWPGGGSGGYVKHVLTFGLGGPTVGSTISFNVGAGGVGAAKIGNGNGANGRAKFSWT